MSDIIKYNGMELEVSKVQSLPKVSEDVKRGILAKQSQRISYLSAKDLQELVMSQLVIAGNRLGQKNFTDERFAIISKDLSEMLRTKYKVWTTAEFAEAMRLGAMGEGVEREMHITLPALKIWMDAYDERIRRECFTVLQKIKDEEPEEKPMTKEEEDEAIMDAFSRWKQNPNSAEAYSFLLPILERRGYVKLSTEEKWEIVKRAKEKMLAVVTGIMRSQGLSVHFRKQLAEIKAMEIGDAKGVPASVRATAENLAVVDYFKRCEDWGDSPVKQQRPEGP